MIKKPKSDPPACTAGILALQDALEALGGKWKLLILHYLITREEELNTFKKIEKDIEGISAKMLSKELKSLEANRLISRTELKTKPIMVAYAITDYGKNTASVINHLAQWGIEHRAELFMPNPK